jgi:hypothetical protein
VASDEGGVQKTRRVSFFSDASSHAERRIYFKSSDLPCRFQTLAFIMDRPWQVGKKER